MSWPGVHSVSGRRVFLAERGFVSWHGLVHCLAAPVLGFGGEGLVSWPGALPFSLFSRFFLTVWRS